MFQVRSFRKNKSLDNRNVLNLEEAISDWLTRELSSSELEAIINIQKVARGYLQRRIVHARTPGTEKNLLVQRILQSTMTILKADPTKYASLLFKYEG